MTLDADPGPGGGVRLAPSLVVGSDAILVSSHRIAARLARSLPIRLLAPPDAMPTVPVFLSWQASASDVPWMQWVRQRIIEVAEEATAADA
ncbi:MAG: hypothetical protein AAGA54_33015 [Myxococcota bacterium]